MKSCGEYLFRFFLMILIGMCVVSHARAAVQSNQPRSDAYFSQGQTIYDAQDRSKSQREAIRDFLAQAVTQAVATFLSPPQMGAHYARIQEKILSRPDRYVDTYQLFSESPDGGLYRVVGQVTVSTDILKKDLMELGVLQAESAVSSSTERPEPSPDLSKTPGPETPVSEPPVSEPPVPSEEGPREIAETDLKPDTLPPEAQAAVEGAQGRREADKAVSRDRREVLWAVAEKWDQEWYLPEDAHDPQGLLALSVEQEMEDYRYSLRFPRAGTLKADINGNVSSTLALSQARELGIENVVVGMVVFRQGRNQPARLTVTLQVFGVSSGKSLGRVQKEQVMEDLSNEEGAMELASAVSPQLTSFFSPAPGTSEKPPDAAPPVARPIVGDTGEWTLKLHSDRQLLVWKEMEKVLREQFKTMQVKSIHLGADSGAVELKGVDGKSLLQMNGVTLPCGLTIRIDELSPDERVINVSFTSSEPDRSGVRQ